MKIIRCSECGDVVALSKPWRSCVCWRSGGAYMQDLRNAIVAGPCLVYGVDNRIFFGQRREAWPYDESNGKIKRLKNNPQSKREAERLVRLGLTIACKTA